MNIQVRTKIGPDSLDDFLIGHQLHHPHLRQLGRSLLQLFGSDLPPWRRTPAPQTPLKLSKVISQPFGAEDELFINHAAPSFLMLSPASLTPSLLWFSCLCFVGPTPFIRKATLYGLNSPGCYVTVSTFLVDPTPSNGFREVAIEIAGRGLSCLCEISL